jgi:U4/U6.U5 tri-snRNP-associated protein 1
MLGKIAGNQEAKKLMKDKLKLQQKKIESLGSGPLRIASEYYTAEEMISFKKVKRRVKKIQSNVDGILKADDDLIQETQEGTILSDLGTSSRKKKINEDAPEGFLV